MPRPTKASRFIDDDAEVSGSDSGDEVEDDEETEADRKFIVHGKVKSTKRERVEITAEEKELCEDDFDLVREAVLGTTCKDVVEKDTKKHKKGVVYKDSDEDDVHSSDADFIASETDDEGIQKCEKDADKVVDTIRKFVAKQGIILKKPETKPKKPLDFMIKDAFYAKMDDVKFIPSPACKQPVSVYKTISDSSGATSTSKKIKNGQNRKSASAENHRKEKPVAKPKKLAPIFLSKASKD